MNMIDEIGARILASLEESWVDNVFTLINTVYHPRFKRGFDRILQCDQVFEAERARQFLVEDTQSR